MFFTRRPKILFCCLKPKGGVPFPGLGCIRYPHSALRGRVTERGKVIHPLAFGALLTETNQSKTPRRKNMASEPVSQVQSDCWVHFVVDSAAVPPRSFRFSAPPVNSISSIAPSTAD